MNILALDTATDACSAALLHNGQPYEVFELAPRRHTHLILQQIEQSLAAASLNLQDIDALAFGQGPGAFTGLRIAAGVVQGLALAIDKPVIAVSTLAAMALQAIDQQQATTVYVGLDARMSEVYWGVYQAASAPISIQATTHHLPTVKTLCVDCVIKPDSVPLPQQQTGQPTDNKHPASGCWAIGSAWQAYPDALTQRLQAQSIELPNTQILPDFYPSAAYIARLAWVKALTQPQESLLDAAQAQPIYLRNKVAQTIAERQQQAAR
ncbi:MAG TPA: tRNA (adenosine(37)-N6)-threonylcarbamoyltransferase complex dimerization subunit type 1 TsaB [Thiothrix sp.]|nr:tRNA (adenosine(37)-N6)-threonylcarbamoyltransferase complex dimerization subunit type 1 TsaB [Thiothrix sp.]